MTLLVSMLSTEDSIYMSVLVSMLSTKDSMTLLMLVPSSTELFKLFTEVTIPRVSIGTKLDIEKQ